MFRDKTMGHIIHSAGVKLILDKQVLTPEMEQDIRDFIKKSRKKNE